MRTTSSEKRDENVKYGEEIKKLADVAQRGTCSFLLPKTDPKLS